MDNSAQSKPNTRPPTRGRVARRACVPCRLSKVKCDGKEPCSRCEKRALLCIFGVDRRSVTKRKSSPRRRTEKQFVQEDRRPESSFSKEQVSLLNNEVYCSISGSDVATSSTMHLHYGPSSTFVFMQQLHRFLGGNLGSKGTLANGQSANYTAEVVNKFGYNAIFFGGALDSDEPGTKKQSMSSTIFNPEPVPFEVAADFLEKYLSSLHHVLPFCDHATFRTLFYKLYSTMESSAFQSRDSTLVIAVLAVGATLTDNSSCADSLFQRASVNLNSWGDAVSLRSVQILMLMSEFHLIRGRPNSAMLAIGSAVQKSLAIGLHHEASALELCHSKESLESDRGRTRERQSTFWALYSRDRNLSLWIGRPASINDMDVDVPYPTGDRNLEAIVTLARISNRVYYSVYGRKKGSVAEFCRTVQRIHEELLCFHDSLAAEIRFPLDELGSTLHLTTAQMILAFDFYQTMIIALRPCLILDAVQRRSGTKSGDKPLAIPVEWLSWLNTKSLLCSKASMHIIHLFAGAIDHDSRIGRMRHSRFFLEGACFVLLFDVLRDPRRDECAKNLQAVAEGLQCFARLPADKLILISTAAVTKMLQFTNELVAKSKSKSTSGQGDEPPYRASDRPEHSTFSDQHMVESTNLPVDHGLSNSLNNDIAVTVGDENFDFFNDIFDLSYYLWTEDAALTNRAW